MSHFNYMAIVVPGDYTESYSIDNGLGAYEYMSDEFNMEVERISRKLTDEAKKFGSGSRWLITSAQDGIFGVIVAEGSVL